MKEQENNKGSLKIIGKDIVPRFKKCVIAHNNKNIECILHENVLDLDIDKLICSVNNAGIKTNNQWSVIDDTGDRKFLCKCSCGRVALVSHYNINYCKSKSCGHERIKDLKDRVFGEWKVIEYAGTHNGMSMWKCECSCGEEKVVYSGRLLSGRSKSCGHNTNAFKDIKDKTFGEWTAIEFAGNHSWLCRCSCGIEKIVDTKSLYNGDSKSCGHLRKQYRNDTMLKKYGEIATKKLDNKRSKEQIEILNNKDLLKNLIEQEFGGKTTALELSNKLGVNTYNIYKRVHEYNLENMIYINYNSSKYEDEIINYIKSIGNYKIEHRNKSALNGQELDIYIPEKKLAIEFNGSYWHSETYKDKNYHQQKTIGCAKQGIQLIHIFEYEWNEDSLREKILNIIRNKLNPNYISKIYGRNIEIQMIENKISAEFLDKYHLQNGISSAINLGCYYQNELIGVMTFGKPRFNKKYEYEIHRFCWKPNIQVVGGTEKLFKYFLKNYNPQSIITYSDISKFTGNVYTRLGFKPIQPKPITEPNYVWYNEYNKIVLNRYQTQKHKLMELGLGTKDQTEIEIMHNKGYTRIYDSGNIKLEWRR